MMREIVCLGLLGVVLTATPVFADQIELTNGDRITGKIIEQTADTVVVETRAMGRVSIDRTQIKPEPAEQSAAAETPSDVEWERTVSAGFSQSGGNTEKAQGNAAVFLNRKTSDNEITAQVDAYYSSSNQQMDAKKFYGMGRYAYSFGRRLKWYHFYKVEGDQDRFANIDYRITPASGVGYWFSDDEDFKLMGEMAVGYQHTAFRNGSESTNEAVLVPRGYFDKKLMENLRLTQDLVAYPSLSEAGDFRMRSRTELITKISERLAWKVSFLDEYNSAPSGAARKNDYRVVTGIDYSF